MLCAHGSISCSTMKSINSSESTAQLKYTDPTQYCGRSCSANVQYGRYTSG